MKRLTNLLVVALLVVSFSVLVSSCDDETEVPKYEVNNSEYFVSFTFTGDIDNISFNAVNTELDDKGNVLASYEFVNVTSGSKTKTYTAHKDAVKVQTLVTFVIHDPKYGDVKGTNGWEFTNKLTKNAITEINISLKDFKYELDLKKNIKVSVDLEYKSN